ncbi:hypothetical protein ScPMuIL_017842 [Solemya velum]
MAFDDLRDKYDFRVHWHPFLLRPNMPPEGAPKPEAYLKPSPNSALQKAGTKVGIDFTYKSTRFPNTLLSHALLDYAKDDVTKQNHVAELLFKKYFTDGDSLGQETILAIAEKVGLDKSGVTKHIVDPEVVENVRRKAEQWSARGVSGVPMFYMNGQRMFSGAQEVEVFKNALNMAAERFPVQTVSNS